MTTVNGSISISCLNCDKVFLMVDQLTKSMQEFEIFTMEIQFDPKSAKFKSQEVLSNFWQLISTIKSFINVSREQNLQALAFSQTPNPKPEPNPEPTSIQNENQSLVRSVLKQEVKSEPEESESESDYEYKPARSKFKSKSRSKFKSRTVRKKLNVRPNPNETVQRLNELKKSHKLLRTIECETDEGYYNLYECMKCGRQFNDAGSCRRHIQLLHLNLGTPCPSCSHKYFTQQSLDRHILRCSQGRGRQFKLRKVPINSESNKLVQVHLYPRQQQQQQKRKQKQKQSHSTLKQNQNRNKNRNRHQNKNSDKKIKNEREKDKKPFDPMKIKVRNPCPYFSLKTALNVKVLVERLDMDKVTKKIEPSPQNQIPTPNLENGDDKLEDIVAQTETGTETGGEIIKVE